MVSIVLHVTKLVKYIDRRINKKTRSSLTHAYKPGSIVWYLESNKINYRSAN